jgi:Domain of unknown function (DUF3303)
MKFIVSWTVQPENFAAVVGRFLETGGRPPEGVKMLGRWIGMNGRGVTIAESNDAKALYAWTAQWSDVMALETTPCVEDAEAGAVLASLKR